MGGRRVLRLFCVASRIQTLKRNAEREMEEVEVVAKVVVVKFTVDDAEHRIRYVPRIPSASRSLIRSLDFPTSHFQPRLCLFFQTSISLDRVVFPRFRYWQYLEKLDCLLGAT